MKVAILVDASVKIGLGHFYRCITLGNLFRQKGCSVHFFFQELDDELEVHLREFNFSRVPTSVELFEKISKAEYSYIVTDFNKSSRFNSEQENVDFYKTLKREFSGKLVVFDAYDHVIVPADAFIIPYPQADKKINKSKTAAYFTGLKYMFFRNDFYGKNVEIRKEIEEVMIFMGGTDPLGFSKKILRFFTKFDHDVKKITLLTGINSKLNQKDIEEFSEQLNIEFIKGTNNVPEFMEKADLGIVNSGLVKYEAAFVGLPLITISNEISHEPVMHAFQKATLNPHLGLGTNLDCLSFEKCFKSLNFQKRMKINHQSSEIFSDDRFLLINELLNLYE